VASYSSVAMASFSNVVDITEAMNKDGAGDGLERGNDRASRSRQEPGSA
jgi:hypothetical protein